MNRMADRAERILRPLSALTDQQLTLVENLPADDPSSIVTASGLGVRRADGQPLDPNARQLVHQVFDLIRTAEESESKFRDLEHRVMAMQHENLELIMRNRVLAEVSARDTLTGLYNRWYVMEKIESEMNRTLRHGSPVSVLMMDIDHFKRVNDTYGHAVGDQVLRTIGQVLRDSCRVYDVPGRYGGEEFCIVLPETPVGNTCTVAERIRTRVEATAVAVDGDSVAVTTSIGVAGVDGENGDTLMTATALIDRADRALYSAKHRGRNRIEMWC